MIFYLLQLIHLLHTLSNFHLHSLFYQQGTCLHNLFCLTLGLYMDRIFYILHLLQHICQTSKLVAHKLSCLLERLFDIFHIARIPFYPLSNVSNTMVQCSYVYLQKSQENHHTSHTLHQTSRCFFLDIIFERSFSYH